LPSSKCPGSGKPSWLSLGVISTMKVRFDEAGVVIDEFDQIGLLAHAFQTMEMEIAVSVAAFDHARCGIRDDDMHALATTSHSLSEASTVVSDAVKQSVTSVFQISQRVDVVVAGAQPSGENRRYGERRQQLSRTAERIATVAMLQAESIALTM